MECYLETSGGFPVSAMLASHPLVMACQCRAVFPSPCPATATLIPQCHPRVSTNSLQRTTRLR